MPGEAGHGGDDAKGKRTVNNGMIQLDSDAGRLIGFTSDKFHTDSYLWKQDGRILISFIHSKEENKGSLSSLLGAIESLGLKVAVPTPLARMQSILERKGFKPHIEEEPGFGNVEVWEKP